MLLGVFFIAVGSCCSLCMVITMKIAYICIQRRYKKSQRRAVMSQPSLQKRPASWPGDNDREVVRQMLEDPLSPHWQDCRDFIMRLVRKLNVPVDHQDDVVQEMMITVTRNLPNFKHNCKLTTWLGKSVHWRVSDLRREIVNGKKLF